MYKIILLLEKEYKTILRLGKDPESNQVFGIYDYSNYPLLTELIRSSEGSEGPEFKNKLFTKGLNLEIDNISDLDDFYYNRFNFKIVKSVLKNDSEFETLTFEIKYQDKTFNVTVDSENKWKIEDESLFKENEIK